MYCARRFYAEVFESRRTGRNVKEVARDDEGFEDFAEMAEANDQSPMRNTVIQSNRTPSIVPALVEDGEGSKDMSFAEGSEILRSISM
jgi:hypothetical protein